MSNASGGKPPVLHKKHVARLEREKRQSRMIIYTFAGILAVILLLLGYGILDMNYLQLQKPVAKVGDVEILVNQFEARVRLQRQQLLSQYNMYAQYGQLFGMDVQGQLKDIETQLNTPESVGQTVLDQMINEQLIRLEAQKRGLVVSQEQVIQAQQENFSYFPNGTPTAAPTATEVLYPDAPAQAFAVVTKTPIPTATSAPEETATATPEATDVVEAGPTSTPLPTATPYTQAGFEKELNASMESLKKMGIKEADFTALFEFQVINKLVQDAITASVPTTETQVWARHILVPDEATAVLVLDELKNGGDFAALAAKYSTDSGSAVNGGDLGWFGKGAMVPEFEAAAFALEKPGDITPQAVKSTYGYHIIQLIAKQERPLDSNRYESAKNQAFSAWLTAARDEYGVEIFDIWKKHVPSEPNFITAATEAVNAQNTALAKKDQATAAP